MKKVTFVLILTMITTSLYAHSGRTDKTGCHNETKTGTRHCH